MREECPTRIVEAASRLIVSRGGVGSVSLEDIAREAGLTKGGVQYHYPTRAEIVAAVTRRLVEEAHLACARDEASTWARLWLALLVHSWAHGGGEQLYAVRAHTIRARAIASLTSGRSR